MLCAAIRGHTECIKLLITRHDILVNAFNKCGWTAFHYATKRGHYECIQVLLTHKDIDVNSKPTGKRSPFDLAAIFNYSKCMAVLLSAPQISANIQTNSGDTPLHTAGLFGATECTKLLLQHKDIKVDIKNRMDSTPLELAASVRSSNNADIVCLLRQHRPTESTVFISLIFILCTDLCCTIHLFNRLCFIFFLCSSLHGYAFHYIPLSCIYVNLLRLLLFSVFNSFRSIGHTSSIHIFIRY